MLTKVEALKTFFGSLAKPLTGHELTDFKKNDPKGFEELAQLAKEALEAGVPQVAAASVEAAAPDALTVGALV